MRHLTAQIVSAMGIAMALMATANAIPAGATELYWGSTTLGVNTTIHATLEAGTSTLLTDTSGNPIDTCTTSTVHGSLKYAGTSTTTAYGDISELTWGAPGDPCTMTTTTVARGQLEIHHIAGAHNGTLTGKGTVVAIQVFGNECLYGTEPTTDLGTLTGTTDTAKHATMDINAIILELPPKKFLCPDTTRWIANYTVTSPTGLNVRAS